MYRKQVIAALAGFRVIKDDGGEAPGTRLTGLKTTIRLYPYAVHAPNGVIVERCKTPWDAWCRAYSALEMPDLCKADDMPVWQCKGEGCRQHKRCCWQ